MIRLRLHISPDQNEPDVDIPHIDSEESLADIVDRALAPLNLIEDIDPKVYFAVTLNGIVMDPRQVDRLWEDAIVHPEDNVLICPRLHGGDDVGGTIFRTFVIIAATAYLGPLAAGTISTSFTAGTVGYALTTAAVSITATLAVYALFPPPLPGNALGDAANIERSQMYSISGQSNRANLYGNVPKVYGTHKMFPYTAANPYIELEADPNTGEIIQYLHAIYDFGLGPLAVTDLRIGDTPVESFSDVEFNFVDPLRPVDAVEDGLLSYELKTKFSLYKGDNSAVDVSVQLNDNEVDAGPVSGYQVVRTSAFNADSVAQKLSVDLIFPQGLYAFSANGTIGDRTVELIIEFRKVGSTAWRKFNDPIYVEQWSDVGAVDTTLPKVVNADISSFYTTYYFQVRPALTNFTTYVATTSELGGKTPIASMGTNFWGTKYFWGLRKGIDNFIILETDPDIVVGSKIRLTNTSVADNQKLIPNFILGTVASIVNLGNIAGKNWTRYVFTAPVSQNVTLFEVISGQLKNTDTTTTNITRVFTVGRYYLDRTALGIARIIRQTSEPTFATISFTPYEVGQFEVRVTRIRTFSTFTTQTGDNMTVSTLTSRFAKDPIVPEKRHTFLEIKIKATNQLNGAIDSLNALVSSILLVWNGSAWVKEISSNPAWVYADLLCGEINKKSVSRSRLDIDSLVEWADYCDEVPPDAPNFEYLLPRFTCNFVLDFSSTLQQLLLQVSGAAQATFAVINGKYGVLVDKQKTVPVQIFTPRNLISFNSTRVFSPRPHALRVKYVDSGGDHDVKSVTVYDNGFNFNNATEFEDVTSFACTNQEQAFRFGRYLIASNRLRQEIIRITVDFEYLVCTRGDYVQVTQDVMKVGGSPARVKSIAGNQIVIDDGLDIGAGPFGYVFRSSTGVISSGTCTQVSANTWDLTGPLPAAGNLIVIGNVGQVVYDCLVKSIEPGDDLTATLILIEKADGVYAAESTLDFPDYDPQINQTTDPFLVPPGPVQTLAIEENTWRCDGDGYQYYIFLDWEPPTNSAYELFNVYVNNGQGFNLAGSTRLSEFEYIVDEAYLGVEHSFRVIAVSATGRKLELSDADLTTVSAIPVLKTTRPSDVEGLSIDITGEVLQLVWPAVNECDINEYLIRYSPNVNANWASTVPLLRAPANATLASTQARTGVYLIKAVDFNGNESENPAAAITTIPNLFNLNLIEEIDDFPTLGGIFELTENIGGGLYLRQAIPGDATTRVYYSNGYYYYQNLLDLGDIYTVRLQSQVDAEGFTDEDIMSSWTTLDAILYMANARTSEWDVETEYRSTNTLSVMSSWATLSSVSIMSGGSDDNWTPWRKFIIGDATGRLFQFRLRLISNKASVTPKVISGIVRADMPDRVDSYNDISAPDTGYTLTYSPAFAGPGTTPNVQISLQDGQSGDYWVFGTKTLEQFQITFYNNSNVAVARTFDAVVKGYGRKNNTVI